MSAKTKTAFVLFSIIIAMAFIIGVQYLASSKMTSYHLEVIGVEWDTLTPGAQTLLLVLMKGVGDAAIVCGLSMLFILLVPFRSGENWSRWALLTIGSSCLLPMLIGAVYLAKTTGASSPWWLNAALITLLILGFLLSGDFRQHPKRAFADGTVK